MANQPPPPPLIVSQPVGTIAFAGSNAVFAVEAMGDPPLSYQWFHDGSPVPGETAPILQIDAVDLPQEGNYRVRVSNAGGTVLSSAAYLRLHRDFGDAPTGFPTRVMEDGARHVIRPGMFLGITIDPDANGSPEAHAQGDDQVGEDDEDGVAVDTPLLSGQTNVFRVTASTNGFLDAWLDVQGDGAWDGPSDHIFDRVPLHSGLNLLPVSLAPQTSPGAAVARFRFSAQGGLSPGGDAPVGEVEDEEFFILPVTDLEVSAVPQEPVVYVGDPLIWNVTVTNRGPGLATAVVLSHTFPLQAVLLEVTSSHGSCLVVAGEVTCTLGDLLVGATAVVEIVARVDQAMTVHGSFVVTTPQTDLDLANNTSESSVRVIGREAKVIQSPAPAVVPLGGDALFQVEVDGEPPIALQWFFNGRPLPGQTNAQLLVAGADLDAEGLYFAEALNAFGRDTSRAAPLDVLVPPFLTKSPAPPSVLTVAASAAFRLEGVAIGDAPLTYQWTRDGVPLLGQDKPVLEVLSAGLDQGGSYALTVANPAGDVTSAPVLVRVLEPPRLVLPPAALMVPLGSNATLSVLAEGSPPLQYQWRINGVALPGATLPDFAITNALPRHRGLYQVEVRNEVGFVLSDPVEVVVVIDTLNAADFYADRVGLQSQSNVVAGSSLGATAEPDEALHAGKPGSNSVWYAWTPTQNGVATFRTAGSAFDTLLAVYTNSPFLGLPALAADDDGGTLRSSLVQFNAVAGTSYAVVVDGFAGQSGNYVVSWDLLVTTNQLPVITQHPQRQTVEAGQEVLFQVVASGNALSYQWLFNGAPIEGATTNTLLLPDVTRDQVGRYRVRITNPLGRDVFSRPAALELGSDPDLFSVDKPAERFPGKFRPPMPQPLLSTQGLTAFGVGSGGFSSITAGTVLQGTLTVHDYGVDTEPLCAGSSDVLAVDLALSTNFIVDEALALLVEIDAGELDTAIQVSDELGICYYTNGTQLRLMPIRGVAHDILFFLESGASRFDYRLRFDYPLTNLTALAEMEVVEEGRLVLEPQVDPPAAANLTYQWFLDGAPLEGATTRQFILAELGRFDGGLYQVLVRNEASELLVDVARVTVKESFRVDVPGDHILTSRWTETPSTLQLSTNLIEWVDVAQSDENGVITYDVEKDSPSSDVLYYRLRQGGME